MSRHRKRRASTLAFPAALLIVFGSMFVSSMASAEDEITIPYGYVTLVCGTATVEVEAHYSPIDESTAEFVVEFIPDEGDPSTLDTVVLPREGDNTNHFGKSYIIGVDIPQDTAGVVRLNVDGAELTTSDNLNTCDGDVNEPPVDNPDPVDPPVDNDNGSGSSPEPQDSSGPAVVNSGA